MIRRDSTASSQASPASSSASSMGLKPGRALRISRGFFCQYSRRKRSGVSSPQFSSMVKVKQLRHFFYRRFQLGEDLASVTVGQGDLTVVADQADGLLDA